MTRRAAIIVLDGLGIGQAHDSAAYGDEGSNTLGNVARAVGGLRLPNLAALGLGNCAPIAGVQPAASPGAAQGICEPSGAGKDSTTGHWEICGLVLGTAFPTYPSGFPPEVIEEFAQRTGRGVIGNRAASGTQVLDELGEEHRRTGKWIVYTSADSVFQVASHIETVPLEELYAACRVARAMLQGEHGVSRVIARPFSGVPGAWVRTAERKDFSLPPPAPTLLDRLDEHHVPRVGVGKVDDLFDGRGISSVAARLTAEAFSPYGVELEDTLNFVRLADDLVDLWDVNVGFRWRPIGPRPASSPKPHHCMGCAHPRGDAEADRGRRTG